MSAVISACGKYRPRLDRVINMFGGPVYAFFGVNGSTAGPDDDDHTVRKWNGFTALLGGSRYIVGNIADLRSKDVKELGRHPSPISSENARHLREIIAEADILVPCWGSRHKVPKHLRHRFDELADQLFASGKPVKVWGFTASGDPLHPLTLGYDTPLVDWVRS
jgi:hypothetical protein